jgi:hypothetical protein
MVKSSPGKDLPPNTLATFMYLLAVTLFHPKFSSSHGSQSRQVEAKLRADAKKVEAELAVSHGTQQVKKKKRRLPKRLNLLAAVRPARRRTVLGLTSFVSTNGAEGGRNRPYECFNLRVRRIVS